MRRLLSLHLLLLHLSDQNRAFLYSVVKLAALLAGQVCLILKFPSVVPWCPTVIENNLTATSTRSSSCSALSYSLITFTCSYGALICRSSLYLHLVGRHSFHHQLVATTVAFIVAHWFAEIAKQLLWCLNEILQKMTIICYMFSNHLTNSPILSPTIASCLRGIGPPLWYNSQRQGNDLYHAPGSYTWGTRLLHVLLA